MRFPFRPTGRPDDFKEKEAQILRLEPPLSNVVGERGLEPPRIATLDPKSSASANSATRPRVTLLGNELLRIP